MSLRKSMMQSLGSDINYTNDYTAGTWALNSFDFDNTNNVFTGDSTISTTINNSIVGSNKQFTMSFWVRRKTPISVGQAIFCRDKSTATSARQFLIAFTSANVLQVAFYTNSTNNIQYLSTNTLANTFAWNNITIVYDGTQSATSRITVYVNGIAFAGTTTQTGTFTTINNITTPSVTLGARVAAASYGSYKISETMLFNTNLSAANVAALYNTRVPFDIRTNAALNANLVMYLNASYSTSFSTNWSWTDLVGGGVFTSSGMVVGDLVADAPALKQISVVILFGQSNAAGRVPMAQLESKYVGTKTWLQFWDGTNFVDSNTATNNNQLVDLDNSYGIEFYLGDKLNKFARTKTRIFKYGRGGTALSPDLPSSWCVPTPGVQPAGGTVWQTVHNNYIPDLQYWELLNGYTITKIRLIWIQGEADCQNLSIANAYGTNWTNFLASIVTGQLKDLFYITTKVYDCLLSANQTYSVYLYKSNVNSGKTTVQATDTTNYRTFNTDTATVQVDESHYDKAGISTIALGVGNLIITDGI
jgi:hypothetical protein